jgi:hypothetical protein
MAHLGLGVERQNGAGNHRASNHKKWDFLMGLQWDGTKTM